MKTFLLCLLYAALLLSAGPVRAACRNDSDCPGKEICKDETCTSPKEIDTEDDNRSPKAGGEDAGLDPAVVDSACRNLSTCGAAGAVQDLYLDEISCRRRAGSELKECILRCMAENAECDRLKYCMRSDSKHFKAFCIDEPVAAPEPESADKAAADEPKIRTRKEIGAGVKGGLIPTGRANLTRHGGGHAVAASGDYKPSGNVAVFGEYRFLPFLAAGGEFGVFILNEGRKIELEPNPALRSVETVTQMDLNVYGRVAYPGIHFEPYIKAGTGPTWMVPSNEVQLGPQDNPLGWNLTVLPGLMYRWDRFGIFAESGVRAAVWASRFGAEEYYKYGNVIVTADVGCMGFF